MKKLELSAFIVRLELSSPVIMNPRLSLDGVLASTVFDQSGSLDAAHDRLPLQRSESIYCASDFFCEEPAPRTAVKLVRNMKPGSGLTEDMVRPKRGSKLSRIRTHRGDYKTLMDTYTAYSTRALWAFGQGDLKAIEELLMSVGAIGKKRAQGFGAVEGLDIEEVNADRSFGLMANDGSPARAVPWETWLSIGGRSEVSQDVVPFALPRWSSAEVLCAVPDKVSMSRRDLRAMMG